MIKIKTTSLCYIYCKDEYLLLCRDKKENDVNEGKWVGVGGKLEEDEDIYECVKREVLEETGIVLKDEELRYHGLIHFVSDEWENEDMYLYSACISEISQVKCCDEGTLKWIKKDDLFSLPMWEGDKVFLERMLAGEENIHITLQYAKEKLVKVTDNAKLDFLKSMDFMRLGQNINHEQWQAAYMCLRRMEEKRKAVGFEDFAKHFYNLRAAINRRDIRAAKQILSLVVNIRARWLNEAR